MYSNGDPERASSTSITARLVLFYLVIVVLILLCTNWLQFKMLTADLEYEDNDFVVERITSLRAIIARHPQAAALKDYIPLDSSGDQTRYLVRIQDAEGRTIIESPGIAAIPSTVFPEPVVAGHKIGRAFKHAGPEGKHYLLNSGWAEALGDPHFRLVQVALDDSQEVALMEKYRLKMLLSILAGLTLAAALAILVTRNGLRPLKEMATRVARITESDLHQRVGTGGCPKELEQLAVALDGMLARLEDSFARLSEFSANLSHELRTPLNNLRGEAEVALSQARSPEEYRRIIESSIEEYERLTRMVGDILFLARPDDSFEPQRVDARIELETVAEYFRTVAEEQETSISISGEGIIRTDRHLFQRVIGNLLSNALRYTSAGGVIGITVSKGGDGSATVTVRDTGMGIPVDDLPRVFDRFFRSSQARVRYNQGSGLGLSIVRSIMTLHGGDVSISSTPGEGTAVTLLFPNEPASATE